ncbi:Clp protease N-terminal domain-containing protein [Pseudoduganella namucuonensis]|uniref:Clp amino terminal domain-containing protein, pathogenicity island component n=1 Tax=Pseudoduganella namucuonensis TaxID=1035707 RepID=A0A1I7K667_9BURK|nr:Clp protease N-terminal domain-containing protein [Pseudoduganella namucuonensis]SFU92911.1 Clp amino terminal domain-containing protein, pathogenicity island component [Pseudoduganella namucuonensis]
MFNRFKLYWQDIRTVAALNTEAERQAHLGGEQLPGAEHYLLSALSLEEGSARRALQRVGADPEGFRAAISEQYASTLEKMGLDAGLAGEAPPPVSDKKALFNAQPSGQALMRALPDLRKATKATPLCGAHVLLAIARMPHSVAARALKTMGVDCQAVARAAEAELAMMAS